MAAVCSERDAAPTDLDPLYDAVDPEAVDALFPGDAVASSDSVRQLAFTYEGFVVRVAGGGAVDVTPVGADSSREDTGGPAATAATGGPDAPD